MRSGRAHKVFTVNDIIGGISQEYEEQYSAQIAALSCSVSLNAIRKGIHNHIINSRKKPKTKYEYNKERVRDFRVGKGGQAPATVEEIAEDLETYGRASYALLQEDPVPFVRNYKFAVFTQTLKMLNPMHPHAKSIEKLDLSNQLIGHERFVELVDVLGRSQIKYLNISGNKLTSESMRFLATIIRSLHCLEDLNISRNRITDEGMAHIFAENAYSATLKTLNCTYNTLNSASAHHIGNMFKEERGCALEALVVGGKVGIKGWGDEFMKVLTCCIIDFGLKKLKSLVIADAGLSEFGLDCLSAIMACDDVSIELLNVSKNAFSSNASRNHFISALRLNKTLRDIIIRENGFSELQSAQIISIVRSNYRDSAMNNALAKHSAAHRQHLQGEYQLSWPERASLATCVAGAYNVCRHSYHKIKIAFMKDTPWRMAGPPVWQVAKNVGFDSNLLTNITTLFTDTQVILPVSVDAALEAVNQDLKYSDLLREALHITKALAVDTRAAPGSPSASSRDKNGDIAGMVRETRESVERIESALETYTYMCTAAKDSLFAEIIQFRDDSEAVLRVAKRRERKNIQVIIAEVSQRMNADRLCMCVEDYRAAVSEEIQALERAIGELHAQKLLHFSLTQDLAARSTRRVVDLKASMRVALPYYGNLMSAATFAHYFYLTFPTERKDNKLLETMALQQLEQSLTSQSQEEGSKNDSSTPSGEGAVPVRSTAHRGSNDLNLDSTRQDVPRNINLHEVTMDTALIGLNADEILMRAELLLLDVSNVVLKGVPEATETDMTVDDEAVRELLKEGGHPPAQLVLPSVYATNQRVLENLSVASILRIEMKQLLVLSARYGVRKEGTYFVVHPPSGCQRSASEPQTVRVPLDEIHDKVASILQKNVKRDSMRNYFVGSVDLNRKVDLKLSISDKTMQEWMNGSPAGSIRIDLFGYVNPPGTVIRGELAEAERFAYATIPLSGLLGTAGLEAALQCDLQADISTKSVVASRMLNISFGQRTKTVEALGDKLGTVTLKVSVVQDSKGGARRPAPLADIPATRDEKENLIHSALDYVPAELPQSQARFQMDSLGVKPPPTVAPVVFALVLCALEDFTAPLETLLHIAQHGGKPELALTYKTTPSVREDVRLSAGSSLRGELNLSIAEIRMHRITDPARWTPPMLEVWLRWASLRDGIAAAEKKLLGLAKFPVGYKPGSTVLLPVLDVARGVQRGSLRVACVAGDTPEAVETSAHCVLNTDHIEQRGSQKPRASSTAPAFPQEDEAAKQVPVEETAPASSVPPLDVYDEVEETKRNTPPVSPRSLVDPARVDTQLQGRPAPQDAFDPDAELSIEEICALLNSVEEPVPAAPARTEEPPVAQAQRSPEVQAVAVDLTALPDSAHSPVASAAEHPAHHTETGDFPSEENREEESVSVPDVEAASELHRDASVSKSHLLDFSVDGAFLLLEPLIQDRARYEIFGCFLRYSVRGENGEVAASALWWDAECPVVNGSNRHHFVCAGADDTDFADALGCRGDAMLFELCLGDAEGNLPATPTVVGTASLSVAALADFLRTESGYRKFSLSVHLAADVGKTFLVAAELAVVMKISHRVEPALLRQSGGLSAIAAESEVTTPPSAAAEKKDSSMQGPTDAVSRLLGFEITQEDLSAMLYFRDPNLPLPWVPFQQPAHPSQADNAGANADRSEAFASRTELGALSDTAVSAMADPSTGYVALRQSLMALDYIQDMFPAERAHHDVHSGDVISARESQVSSSGQVRPPQGMPRGAARQELPVEALGKNMEEGYESESESEGHSQEVSGRVNDLHDEVADGDEEEDDEGTDVYKSDFESYDGTIESFVRRVEEDVWQKHQQRQRGHGEGQEQEELGSRRDEDADSTKAREPDTSASASDTGAVLMASVESSLPSAQERSDVEAAQIMDQMAEDEESLQSLSSSSAADSEADEIGTEASLGLVRTLSAEEHKDIDSALSSRCSTPSEHAEPPSDHAGATSDPTESVTAHVGGGFTGLSSGLNASAESRRSELTWTPEILSLTDMGVSLVSDHFESEQEQSSVKVGASLLDAEVQADLDGSRASAAAAAVPALADESVDGTFAFSHDTSAAEEVKETSHNQSLNTSVIDRSTRVDLSSSLLPHAEKDRACTEPTAVEERETSQLEEPVAVAQTGVVFITGNEVRGDQDQDQDPEDSVLQGSDREDSPNTSKIKNVVDRRIGQIFGESVVAHPLSAQPEGARRIVMEPGVDCYWRKIEPASAVRPSTSAPLASQTGSCAALSEAQLITVEMERLRGLLSKEPSAGGRMRTRPGLPRNFAAEEMDRASAMMASVFRKAGSL